MEEMISRMVAPFDFPVAYNFPIGHVDHNVPMICSSTVRLEVTTEFSKLLTIG